MKLLKILGTLAVAAAAMMAFAASASATIVTTTTGGAAATPTIHTVNEGGHVTLANPIANISCNLTTEGVVDSHGSGVAAEGEFTNVSFTGCTNSWHVTVHVKGRFRFSYSNGEIAITIWVSMRFTTTRLGVTCTYETNNTTIGTDTSGNPATMKLEASIPINAGESSGLCGSGNAKLEGSMVTTSALYFAP